MDATVRKARAAMDEWRREPEDDRLYSSTLTRCALVVRELPQNLHLFCQADIRDVAGMAMGVFDFGEALEAVILFKQRAMADLQRCHLCCQHYQTTVRDEFRSTLSLHGYDHDRQAHVLSRVADWDLNRLSNVFRKVIGTGADLSAKDGPGQASDSVCALFEVLWAPQLLRDELAGLFYQVFRGVQSAGKHLRVPREIVPGMYSLCFSSHHDLRDWTSKCFDKYENRDKLKISPELYLAVGAPQVKHAADELIAGTLSPESFWRGITLAARYTPRMVELTHKLDTNLMDLVFNSRTDLVTPALQYLLVPGVWNSSPVNAVDFGRSIVSKSRFRDMLLHPELHDADACYAWIAPYIKSQVGITLTVARFMLEWLHKQRVDQELPGRSQRAAEAAISSILHSLVPKLTDPNVLEFRRLYDDFSLAGDSEGLRSIITLDCRLLWTHYLELSTGVAPSGIVSPGKIWARLNSSLTPLADLQSVVEIVGRTLPLVDTIDITGTTQHKDLAMDFNRSLNAAFSAFNAILRDVGGIWASTQIRQFISSRPTHAALIECLVSPNQETYQEALALLKEAHSADDRIDALKGSLEFDFGGTVLGLTNVLTLWSDAVIFKSATRVVRTSTNVLDLLPHVATTSSEGLSDLWRAFWRMLEIAYAEALPFSEKFDRDELVEFMRDVLECSNLLLAQVDLFESRTGTSLLVECLRPVKALTTWLRLNDDNLLNSCVNLVKDMILKLANAKVALPQETILLIQRVMENSRKKKNNVRPSQRTELQLALLEHGVTDDDDVQIIEPIHPAPAAVAQPARTQSAATSLVPKLATKLGVPSRTTSPLPSLKVQRQEYLKNRAALPAFLRTKDASAGHVETVESDSSSDSSSDEEGLFKSKSTSKKTTTVKRTIRRIDTPVVKAFDPQAHRKRLEQTLRARTSPDLTSLYSRILSWDPVHEGKRPPGEPDAIYQTLAESYQTVDQYVKVIEPLFLLECWEHISAQRDAVVESSKFTMVVQTRSAVDRFVDLYVTMQQSDWQKHLLSEPDILLLWGGESCCFARVQQVSKKKELYEVSLRTVPNGAMVRYLRPAVELRVAKLLSLTPIQREYATLKALPYYDLCDQVVNGRPSRSPGSTASEIESLCKAFRVNDPQARAIAAALNSQGGFTLIQGPPGTGKTKTILGMVGALLSNSGKGHQTVTLPGQRQGSSDTRQKAKVLLCAPSNAAVDEIVLRLKLGVFDRHGDHHVPNIVRMGMSDSINVNVRDVTLDVKLDEMLAKAAAALSGKAEGENQDPAVLREKLNDVLRRRELARARLDVAREDKAAEVSTIENEIRALNTEKSKLGEQLDSLRDKQSQRARARDIERSRLRAQILGDADVICATLSGSGHELMTNIKVDFDTVIIDEACQTTELNALIPLKYGCTRCVMVGDPLQLPPTVLSTDAVEFKYNESLFVRMQRNNPKAVHLLAIQYRMHSTISAFPSREFYGGELKDGPAVDLDNKRPWHQAYGTYRLFDVASSREEASGTSIRNPVEADAVMALIDRLRQDYFDVDFDGKIGVVTPYKEQHNLLRKLFRNRYGGSIFNAIDFNTIDGFQGQEKDIIILTTVRAGGSHVGFLQDKRRMNVALTRAKASLFIIGHADTLRKSKVWKSLVDDARKRNCLERVDVKALRQSRRNANGEARIPRTNGASDKITKVGDLSDGEVSEGEVPEDADVALQKAETKQAQEIAAAVTRTSTTQASEKKSTTEREQIQKKPPSSSIFASTRDKPRIVTKSEPHSQPLPNSKPATSTPATQQPAPPPQQIKKRKPESSIFVKSKRR